MMKKLFILLLCCALCISSAAAADPVRIGALKGPTAMGLAYLMDAADGRYEFTLAGSADELTPLLIRGKLDAACLPANLAAILYNKTEGSLCVLAVNTLGVLYIVENGQTVNDISALKGRRLYASGKGSTPEFVLNYILQENGLDPDKDITIEWKNEHTECLNALINDPGAAALLPQPFVTSAAAKAEGISIALDLTEEWDKLQQNSETPSALITGVMVARRDWTAEHPELVSELLDSYASSVAQVNDDPAAAAVLIDRCGIIPAAVAEKAIPACHIVMIEGAEMADMLSGYLAVLYEANAASVGGTLPGADLYYIR